VNGAAEGVLSLGGLLGSRSSAQFVHRRCILPRLLLAAADADSCATLLHPLFSRELCWTPGLLGVALSVVMCVDYKCSETVGSSTAKQYSTVQYRQIGGRIVLAHKKQKRWSRMQIKLFVDCPRFLACLLPLACLLACLLAQNFHVRSRWRCLHPTVQACSIEAGGRCIVQFEAGVA